MTELQNKLLPSHTYSNNYGGLPEHILNLTVSFLSVSFLVVRTHLHIHTPVLTHIITYTHVHTHTHAHLHIYTFIGTYSFIHTRVVMEYILYFIVGGPEAVPPEALPSIQCQVSTGIYTILSTKLFF